MKEKMPLEMRLWLGLDWDRPDDECWVWKKSKDKQGYGAVGHEDKILKVHRAVYKIAYGVTLAPTDFILHLCDNKACANPNHLLRGTDIDNTIDQAVKIRGRFKEISESYSRFLYEKLKKRFEGNPDQGKGCTY